MELIKKILPAAFLKALRPSYHKVVALAASYYFNEPSKELMVIGITGTTGKSTTTHMLAKILNANGKKCGYITTVGVDDGREEILNKHGLSMPGGWLLQKQLKAMVSAGCKYAVVECTSEGLRQNRHSGVDFDYALFTNLSPAHLEAHNGLENYKLAKTRLFAALGKFQTGTAKKTILVNLDDSHAEEFLDFPAQQKMGVSFSGRRAAGCDKVYLGELTADGFILEQTKFVIPMLGEFNRRNALLATAAANSLGVSLRDCARVLGTFKSVPGRMELIENQRGLQIIVDYGCEPASFSAALIAAAALPHRRMIHIFGATGGHRDVAKRAEFGRLSGLYADEIIITNDDVYDSDPERIADEIEAGLKSAGRFVAGQVAYRKIFDRRKAIAYALAHAESGDLILLTGKGSEQFLVLPANQRISWDDRLVVRELLANMN